MRVSAATVLSNRTWYAIVLPYTLALSKATRLASAWHAMRRGWVHAMRRKPAAIRYCGTCVDLPQPAATTVPLMPVQG